MQKLILVFVCMVNIPMLCMNLNTHSDEQGNNNQAHVFRDCINQLNTVYQNSITLYDEKVLLYSCDPNNENYDKFFAIADDRNQQLSNLLRILSKKDFLSSNNTHEVLPMIDAFANVDKSYDKARSGIDDNNKRNNVPAILTAIKQHMGVADMNHHAIPSLKIIVTNTINNNDVLTAQQKERLQYLRCKIDAIIGQWSGDGSAALLVECEKQRAQLCECIMQESNQEIPSMLVQGFAMCNNILHKAILSLRRSHDFYVQNLSDEQMTSMWDALVNKEKALDALQQYYVENIGVLINLEPKFMPNQGELHIQYDELEEYEQEPEENGAECTLKSYIDFLKEFHTNSMYRCQKLRLLQKDLVTLSDQDKEIVSKEQALVAQEQERNELLTQLITQCNDAEKRQLKTLPIMCIDLMRACVTKNQVCYQLMQELQVILKKYTDDKSVGLQYQSCYDEITKSLDRVKTFNCIMQGFDKKYEDLQKKSASISTTASNTTVSEGNTLS